MNRREFLRGACCVLAGAGAGCVTGVDSEPDPELALLEVGNHRRDEGYEFTIEIDDGDAVVFHETRRLGPAGSGTDAVVFEDPVDPGEYTVRVDVDEHAASAATRDLISEEQPCLRLQFYLGSETLHMEPQTYDRCE